MVELRSLETCLVSEGSDDGGQEERKRVDGTNDQEVADAQEQRVQTLQRQSHPMPRKTPLLRHLGELYVPEEFCSHSLRGHGFPFLKRKTTACFIS